MQEIVPEHSSSWCEWTSSNLGRSGHPEHSLAPTCVNSTAKGSYSSHSDPSFCLCDRWQLSTSFKNVNSEGLGNIYRKIHPDCIILVWYVRFYIYKDNNKNSQAETAPKPSCTNLIEIHNLQICDITAIQSRNQGGQK